MKKDEIESRAQGIFVLLRDKFPELSDSDIVALCGYLAAYILNTQQRHNVFVTMGQICYEILEAGDHDGRKENEDQPVGEQTQEVSSSNKESERTSGGREGG